MRGLLILCVLCAAGAAFYWAAADKAHDIQADIQMRVERDLALAGGHDVTVRAQGRHVTLSGVVTDQETKVAYMGVARGTYGALGPIDELNVGDLEIVSSELSVFSPEIDAEAALREAAFSDPQVPVACEQRISEPGFNELADRDVSSVSRETERLKVALRDAQAREERARAQLEDRELQLTAVMGELREQQAALTAPSAREAEQQRNLAALSTELEALRSGQAPLPGDASTLQARNAELLQALTQNEQNLAEIEHDHTETLAELEAKNKHLSVAKNETRQRLAALEADLTESQLENAVLSVALEELRADVELGRTQTQLQEEEKAQLATLQEQLVQKDAQIASLSEKMAALNAQNAAFLENVTEPDVAIAFLQTLRDEGMVIPGLIAQCTQQANEIMKDRTISFQIGTSEIDAQSAELLERMAETIKLCAHEGLIVEIGGHSSALGNKNWNQTLSENRAKAVVGFMIARGIAPGTIAARGFGDALPIASNDTYEGRAKNRRITFEWQARSGQN
jgi:outer membrane protein OmpA-like peptidoglycan-associated protein